MPDLNKIRICLFIYLFIYLFLISGESKTLTTEMTAPWNETVLLS